MSVKHLSDDDIQLFLDMSKSDEDMIHHIKTCQECQKRVSEYESFYRLLNEDTEPGLSSDFAINTMSIIKSDPSFNESSVGLYLYSVIGGVIALLATGYAIGFNALLDLVGVNALVTYFSNTGFIKMMGETFVKTQDIVTIIVSAGIILIFYSLLDKYITKQKVSKFTCFTI